MCGFFNFEGGNIYREITPPSAALIERTRKIEASLVGEPVPENAWGVFFAPVCGAIEWKHFERMFQCRKLALNYLAVQAPFRRSQQQASSFSCIVDE